MDYSVLSRRRTELMGAAMLWVMLFHASGLEFGIPLLNLVRKAGFGGVDMFILLSAMGLAMSLSRREQDYSAFMARRGARILPAYYLVMIPYTLTLILTQGRPWAALLWNSTLLYYWMRSSGAFNWYVAGAMTFYAVTPFCFRRLRDARRRELAAGAAILASLALCQVLTHEGYWYVMDFFYRVPLFFLGLLMGFYVLEGRRLGGKDLLFWGAVLCAGAVYASVSLTAQWISWPIGVPSVFVYHGAHVPGARAVPGKAAPGLAAALSGSGGKQQPGNLSPQRLLPVLPRTAGPSAGAGACTPPVLSYPVRRQYRPGMPAPRGGGAPAAGPLPPARPGGINSSHTFFFLKVPKPFLIRFLYDKSCILPFLFHFS